jgi:hypothetical protein
MVVKLIAAALTILSGIAAAAAQPAPAPSLPRIAIEDPLAAEPPVLLGPGGRLTVPVAVRIAATDLDTPRLAERLAHYRSRKIPVWLAIPAPASAEAATAWRAGLSRLVSRFVETLAVVEISVGAEDPRVAAFAIRLAATDIRAARDDIKVALGLRQVGIAAPRLPAFSADVTAYVDLVAVPAGTDLAAVTAEVVERDPTARVIVFGGDAGATSGAADRVLDAVVDALGTPVIMQAWNESPALAMASSGLNTMAALLTGQVSVLDARVAGLRLARQGVDVTTATRHWLLFEERTFATFLIYWSDRSETPLDLELTLPVEGVPGVHRLGDGGRLAASSYARAQATGRVTMQLPQPGGPVLVDFNEGAAEVLVDRAEVKGERSLTVDEIIARHQQQQRAQDALVHSYIALARMEQHFRPSMADPGYDVVTDNRYYVADDGVEWEELSFSVNGSSWGSDRPPFPLLQPEKVLSLPLELRFDADYRYRLAGSERIGKFDCYVIRFEPAGAAPSLYRGTLWIDRRTFARVQVQAVQTGLSAPVVSNAETQSYEPVTSIGNRPIFLFTRLDARQIMMIAGRNILVEKRVAFTEFSVNGERFADARLEARRSDRIMYRETDRGLRYYVKEGDTRVVSERATRSARAMAMGVTIDPSYGFPLPIFGINYLNFELWNRPDTQLAVLFAGVLIAGNVQRSHLGGTPLDGSLDFFAIAVPSTERLYDAGGERDAERLLTWPLTVGGNLGWQYTAFQKVTAQYHFRFDGYTRERTTSEEYRVPATSLTNGLGVAWDYRRAGYQVTFGGEWFGRLGWREWGLPEQREPVDSDYLKYTASVSRDFFFKGFHKVHLNGAWFGGRDLDRFAKYQFGMFDDTRIHGVPASGVRFGEMTLARGSYSINIFEQYRMDLFLEQAWGRDRAFDDEWQPITGTGMALNFRTPFSTILRIDAGKSFLPDRYRGVGSATLQIMLLKPLR